MAALPVDSEQRLQADIAALIQKFSDTKELYREVCALLFFRYGVTPTGHLLYQYVRRGTMGTPAAVLKKFWEELREKSRHRITHPDLPAELQEVAGGLVVAIWEKANLQAAQNLEAFKAEAEQAIEESRQQVAAAIQERESVQQELAATREQLAATSQKVESTEREKAAHQATIAALERQNDEQATALRAAKADQEQARKDFASELEKMRGDLALAEDRLAKDHTRMLLEIERERQTTSQLQEELESVRKHSRTSDESWRTALEKAHRSLGDVREKSGALEGKLHAAEATLARATAETHALREQVTELKVKLAAQNAGSLEAEDSDEHPESAAPATRRKKQRENA